jgi:hypothetical protein
VYGVGEYWLPFGRRGFSGQEDSDDSLNKGDHPPWPAGVNAVIELLDWLFKGCFCGPSVPS